MLKSVSTRPIQLRIVENFLLIWFNVNSNGFDKEESLNQLRKLVNSIEIFSNAEECLEYLSHISSEQIFLIISNSCAKPFLTAVELISSLQSIYILSNENNDWQFSKKIKGVHCRMDLLCQQLKQDIQQCQRHLTPISFLPSNPIQDIDELDQSFVYSQLIKEILFDMTLNDKAKGEFLEFSRVQYATNRTELAIIDEFERDYQQPSSILWYTRDCFTSRMIHRALRTQDTELILKMGFFIRDLHEQIQRQHSQMRKSQPFTVYYGQGMLNTDFQRLSRNKDGLVSFNDFLLTTTNRQMSLNLAQQPMKNPNFTSVLFHMEINPSTATSPFTSLNKNSYLPNADKDILFSMHTIFRITDVKSIGDRLWQVSLTLTSDNDKKLTQLNKYIEKKARAETGIQRLAKLMLILGKPDIAKEVYMTLLETTAKDDQKEHAHLHHQLGIAHEGKEDFQNALSHYYNSLNISLSYLPLNDPLLCPTYSNIGLVLKKLGNLDGSLEYLQHALDIGLIAPNPNEAEIAIRYNNIGDVFDAQGNQTDALEYYQLALEIEQKCLPSFHPLIGATHHNIGLVYHSLKDYPSALTHLTKALEIDQKSLPSDHPSLIMAHANIAGVLEDLHQYTEAIEHTEKAVQIVQNALGLDHSHTRMLQDYLEQLRRKQ